MRLCPMLAQTVCTAARPWVETAQVTAATDQTLKMLPAKALAFLDIRVQDA